MAIVYTERLAMAKLLLGLTTTTDDNLLLAYLSIAGTKILERAYPFGTSSEDVPVRYQNLQVEIVVYLYNKRGAEGQTSHNESGVSRGYENGDIPNSMLWSIAPAVGLPETLVVEE